MTFSDGLPVQFWLADCETFNEKEVDGINSKCWCQPFQCDDEINIQFQADETSPVTEYSLLIKDEDGRYLTDLPFTEIQSGVHSVTFSPETEEICNEVIALEIAEEDNITRILAPSAWDDVGSSHFDSKTATQFIEALTSVDAVVQASMPLVVPVGAIVVITYTVEVTGTWTGGSIPIFVTFTLKDGGGSTVSTGNLTVEEKTISANGVYEYTQILTATGISAVLDLDLVEQINTGTANVIITVEPAAVLYAAFAAKSDCLNIRTAHSGTHLIEYSNNRNFAGLIYPNTSPESIFYLRVPAVFFHPRLPQETRAIERTSSTIVTSSKLKKQRHMQVHHAPAYFHIKLIIALSHHNVEIDKKQWKMEEGYEMDEGDQRYPLKKGTVYLTEKNYLARNAL